MADATIESLASLLSQSKDATEFLGKLNKLKEIPAALQDITKALKDLETQKKSVSKLDAQTLVDLKRLDVATLKYAKSKAALVEEEEAILKAQQEGNEISVEQKNKYETLAKVTDRARRELRELKQEVVQYNEAAKKNWQENTIGGKVYGALSSSLLKYTVKLGAAALAVKAITRFTDAARLRNDLMIKSFQGLDTSSFEDAGKQVFQLDAALAKAEMTAHRLGVSVSEIRPTMMAFARIVGTTNPEALGSMTEAALAVSKALGMDVAEATDYVALRMEKFGGNVVSTLSELDNIRKESEKTNKAYTASASALGLLGKGMATTVLKGDDMARTLISLARESSIYALNQRYVSGLLRDTTLRLQAQGESYQFAKDAAKNYLEMLTTKAPPFLKIMSGQKLLTSLNSEFTKADPGAFMRKFGDAMERERPGLSKRVKEILGSSAEPYQKQMQLQEMLSGTKVGLQTMNDEFLKVYGSGNAIVALYQQYGATQAEAMLKSAREMKKFNTDLQVTEKMLIGLDKLTGEQAADATQALAKKLGIDEKELAMVKATAEERAAAAKGDPAAIASMQRKADLMEELLKKNSDLETMNKFATTNQEKENQKIKEKARIEAEILNLKKQEAEATSKGLKESLASRREKLEEELNIVMKDDLKTQEEALNDISKQIKDQFDNTSWFTGDRFKEITSGLSRIEILLGLMLASPLLKRGAAGALTFAKDLLGGAGGGIPKLLGTGVASAGLGAITGTIGAGAALGVGSGLLVNKLARDYTTETDKHGEKSDILDRTVGRAFAKLTPEFISGVSSKQYKAMYNLDESGVAVQTAFNKGTRPEVAAALGGTTPVPTPGTTTGPVSTTPSSPSNISGEFVGGVSPDGSITMKVSNFMDAFASAKVHSQKAQQPSRK